MGEQKNEGANDKGIGEGNLGKEPGAPPYADRQYAGEQEPGESGQERGAGGANVSAQGGGTGSSKQGGNTGHTPDASG
jgi:hypothetical protein